ncbi:MAG TPA: mannose-6-phosphate isomerase, class I [Nakamurella sp.]|nr:mannose-6-phosphate isomerase, class I [Nakamurella sp.]
MELMRNRIRPYAWGSRTAIAELTGAPSPAAHPQAELWMGAHPDDPSTLVCADGDHSLAEVVADDPEGMLGAGVAASFGGRFPFLLKVLAAAEPLSLQAHPSAELARLGFEREEAAGLPRSDPNRNYRDPWPKPELICALTEFHALCGFAEPARTVELIAGLGVPQLDHYLALLSGQPDAAGTRALFSSLITIPPHALSGLLDAVLAACVAKVRDGDGPFLAEYRTVLELGERYPGDAGVLASMLLNRVTLHPGQALYLASGNLHAYLSGTGVEIMGNSDNVLRGGLTPKHVDVPELMRVLDFTPGPVQVLTGETTPSRELVYASPAAEFRLARLDVGRAVREITHDGPQVLLVTAGSVTVRAAGGRSLVAKRGQSVWVSASDRDVRLSGSGTVFRATDGLGGGPAPVL